MQFSRLVMAAVVAAGTAAFCRPQAGGAAEPALGVEPRTVRLRLGETVQFRARTPRPKKGESAPAVLWSVDGAGAGNITSTGLFRAPVYAETPATIRILASIEGNAGARAEARVFLEAVSIAVDPPRAVLSVGETVQFRARVEGASDRGVAWHVEGGPAAGTISQSGLYATPAQFATPGTVTVKATSMADPSRSATATLQITGVRIRVEPEEITLKHGQSRRFKATVTGTPHTAVEWSILNGGQGRISSSGLYTMPEVMTTPAAVTLIARSAADPSKSAVARVRVEAIAVSTGESGSRGKTPRRRSGIGRVARRIYRAAAPRVVRLLLPYDPLDMVVRGPVFRGRSGKQYVPLGGVAVLEADVHNSSHQDVRWEFVGESAGRLTHEGIYHAPESLVTPQVVQVRATSAADPTKFALYTLHIPPVVVEADKVQGPCLLDGALQLAARVENTENDRVVWSVEGGEAAGSISETGLYRPPASLTTPAVIRIRAASAADPSKFTFIEVRVPEVRLELSASSAEVRPGRTIRLKTRLAGCAADAGAVTWKLTPEIGVVTADGSYQAPETGGPAVVEVTAILRSDPTKTASTTLKLLER